jgi:hypothetical protein
MPMRAPEVAELPTKSAIRPAGSCGLRHFRQNICPARHGCRWVSCNIGAQHQDRTLAVDDRQPSLDPMADCIPMDFQGAGDFVDRVGAQRFHAPAVGTSVAPFHDSPP